MKSQAAVDFRRLLDELRSDRPLRVSAVHITNGAVLNEIGETDEFDSDQIYFFVNGQFIRVLDE